MASLDVPADVSSAILQPSDPVPEDAMSVQGPNFENPLDLQQFISSYERIGFQANSLGKAIHIINKMARDFQYIAVVLVTYSYFTNRLNGVSLTNRGRTLSQTYSRIPKCGQRRNATCSSVTPPILFPLGFAR